MHFVHRPMLLPAGVRKVGVIPKLNPSGETRKGRVVIGVGFDLSP